MVAPCFGQLILSQQLCKDIRKANDGDQCIGSLFVKMAPYLKMYQLEECRILPPWLLLPNPAVHTSLCVWHASRYSQYVDNHENATNVVKRLRADVVVAETISAVEAKTQSLDSFLIMPVQRVPRYLLLLRELEKYTPTSHVDYADVKVPKETPPLALLQHSVAPSQMTALAGCGPTLPTSQEAVELVRQSATHINEACRLRENRARMLHIQEETGVSVIEPSRTYVADGVLAKVQPTNCRPSRIIAQCMCTTPQMCRRGLKDFHFYLFNDMLLYVGGGTKLTASHRIIDFKLPCSVA